MPRKIGFLTEHELDFFDLFCTVDKIGAKKALKAMARGVRDIADAVNRGDTRWLTTLPGIGATTAEQIVTTLKRKITPFLVQRNRPAEDETHCRPTRSPSLRRSRAARARPSPRPRRNCHLPPGRARRWLKRCTKR